MNPEDFLKQEDEEETLGVVEPLEVPSEALSEEPVVEPPEEGEAPVEAPEVPDEAFSEVVEEEEEIFTEDPPSEAIPEIPDEAFLGDAVEDTPEDVDESIPEIPDEAFTDVDVVPPLGENQESLTADDIRNDPERMKIVRDYMVLRSGDQFATATDEETYDAYINAMRYIASNEISLITDMRLLGQASDEDKEKIGKAYILSNQLGNVFVNDGFWGAVDGIKDYAWGTLTAPSTYAGIGIGKMLAVGGATATRKAALEVAMTAARESAIKQAAKAGGNKVAQKAAAATAVQEVLKQAAKPLAYKTAIATTITEGVIASAQDLMYQEHMVTAGAQDEYSFAQTAISAATGLVSGGVGGFLDYRNIAKGTKGLQDTIVAGNAAFKASKRKLKLDTESVGKAFKEFSSELVDWRAAIARGEKINLDSHSLREKIVNGVIGVDDQLGFIPKLMKEAGVVFNDETPKTHQMISFVKDLAPETLRDLNKAMKGEFGFRLSELLDIVAHDISTGARRQYDVKAVAAQVGNLASANKAARDLVASEKVGQEGVGDVAIRGVEYFQSIWRRSLVSHPGTSAVNVFGWAQAKSAETMAFLLSGVSHGVMGLSAKMASPFSAGAKQLANEELAKASAIFKSHGYLLQNLVDPYSTSETFQALLQNMPEKYSKQLIQNMYAGVEAQTKTKVKKGGTVEGPYGFDASSKWVKGIETYLDRLSVVSLVKAQDSFTKAVSMTGNLDLQLRQATGKGLTETLQTVGTAGIPDEVWHKATQSTLRDVFSYDYTQGKGVMTSMAKTVENISNIPGIGFLFPFGRFLNNSLAFTFRYTPIGAFRVFLKGNVDDVPTALAQAAVGTTFLGMMAAHEGEKYKQGIPWFVTEGEDGTQYDNTNLAPGAFYHIAGRIIYHAFQGESAADRDTMKDLLSQLGSLSMVEQIDRNVEFLKDGIGSILESLSEQDENGGLTVEAKDILSVIGAAGANIGAGFLRPFEPLNVAMGIVNDSDMLVDRAQLEGGDLAISEATRYVDQLFAPFLTDEAAKNLAPRKEIATNPKSDRELNPLARLMGLRVRQPQTSTERMLAEADFPEWRANVKSAIPELDAVINQKVQNVLIVKSEELINSDAWKKATLATRKDWVRTILRDTQGEVRDWIESRPGTPEYLYKARRDYTALPKTLRDEAKKKLGMSDVDDRKLSLEQIEQLKTYVDFVKEYNKIIVE